jgi:hypothetical protein
MECMSLFETIKIADALEEAALLTLKTWFPVYIREVELQSQDLPADQLIPLNALPLPRSYLTADKFDREAADQLPTIVVVSPGLSGRRPLQEGDGSFRVWYHLAVGVFVGANTRADTKRLVRVYTAIARTIMLQKQSLGGFADGTTWQDESYDDNFSFTDQQTIGAGQVVFEIEVDDVVNRWGGPTTLPDPVDQPGSDWTVVDTVSISVDTKR